MPPGSRICPYCGRLNSADETSCFHCQKRLPGAVSGAAHGLFDNVLGREYPATKILLGICIVVFALSIIGLPMSDIPLFLGGSTAFILRAFRFGMLLPQITGVEPWRVLSAVFVHLSVLHIVFNGMALVDLGRLTEMLIGSARTVFLFVVTGVLGFVASYLLVDAATAGASGAIFGLMGNLIGYLYAKGDPNWKRLFVRFAVYAAMFALMLPVNNAAHIGGFVAGALLGFAFYRERRPDRQQPVFNVLAVLLILASILSVVLSATSKIVQAEVDRAAQEQGPL